MHQDLKKRFNKVTKKKNKRIVNEDRLKIIYAKIFIVSLILSLFYALAKDIIKIYNSYFSLIFLITLTIALISYSSYHKTESKKTFKATKFNSLETPKIIQKKLKVTIALFNILKAVLNFKKLFSKVLSSRKDIIKPELPKKDKEQKLINIYTILSILGILCSIVFIIYSVWLMLLLLIPTIIFSLFSLKKLSKKEIKNLAELREIIKSKKWYETDIDKLLLIINKNKMITLSDINFLFHISKEKAETWGNMLERHGLIKLHYPAVGELMLVSNTFKIPYPNARNMFKYFLVMLSIIFLFVLLLILRIYLF